MNFIADGLQSKRGYFYGLKVQVIATIDGVPAEFCILSGSCHDLQEMAKLAFDELAGSEVFADAAYTNYEWEGYLLETEKLRLQAPRKTNSKRA